MPMRMSGMVSNLDTESMVEAMLSTKKQKKTKVENNITKLEWKQDKWKALNTKIYSFYTDTLTKMKLQSSFNTKKASSSDETIATITASSTAPEGTHTLQVSSLASAQFITGKQLTVDDNANPITVDTKLEDLGMTVGNVITAQAGTNVQNLTITNTTTVGEFVNSLKSAGLSASYDTTNKRFFISSKASGTDNAFSLTATTASELAGLGLDTVTNISGNVSVAGGSIVTLVKPSNANYTYNGTALTSSSNNIAVNGLNITLKKTTGTDVSLSVSKDTAAVYDTVKNFVTKYNEVLKEMNTSYHSASARGFDPLTDEQKEKMTDDQIEKWENKIKDSLLKQDGNLSSLISTMRTKMGESVTVGGKGYSLSSFGITTSSDYTEKGLLHIDGNSSDSISAAKPDKLLKAITEDPDTVMTVMTKLADNLYTELFNNMKSSSLRSALTLYNDKEITKTITAQKKELTSMEKRITDMETRYYKQFSKMETALSKINSQSASLSGFFGNDG